MTSCGPRTGSRRRRNPTFHTQCSPPRANETQTAASATKLADHTGRISPDPLLPPPAVISGKAVHHVPDAARQVATCPGAEPGTVELLHGRCVGVGSERRIRRCRSAVLDASESSPDAFVQVSCLLGCAGPDRVKPADSGLILSWSVCPAQR
jgi:hypothetical protein